MSAAPAHVAALQLILSIAEGSTTANSPPHIGRIAAAALGGRPLESVCRPAKPGTQAGAAPVQAGPCAEPEPLTEEHAS